LKFLSEILVICVEKLFMETNGFVIRIINGVKSLTLSLLVVVKKVKSDFEGGVEKVVENQSLFYLRN
jgi:hypothetical protein